MSKKYPKWDEIRKLESAMLRVVLYTAEGEELERLQAAFPECYSEEQNDLRISRSVLIETIQAKEGASAPTWWGAYGLEDLVGIPNAFGWASSLDVNDTPPLPETVREQLLQHETLECGIKIRYLDEEFILVYAQGTGLHEDRGKPLDLHNNYDIEVVHSKFIDLDS